MPVSHPNAQPVSRPASLTVSLVVAVAENGVIGRDNALPWHLPDDLRHFKRLTLGKPVIMGRKTFLSIGRPLPGRHMIVMTRDPAWQAEGTTVVHSLAEALALAARDGGGAAVEAMVIGGADIFALALPLADRLYLTRVRGRPPGDTYFPAPDPADWVEVARAPGAPGPAGEHTHDYMILERRPSP
jgi:dihydrofolate reductase